MNIDEETVRQVGNGVSTGAVLAAFIAFGHWLWKLVWLPGQVRRLESDRVVLFSSIMALIDDRIETARRPAQKKLLMDARQGIVNHLAKIGIKK